MYYMCNYNINGWWSIVTSGKMQEIPNSTRWKYNNEGVISTTDKTGDTREDYIFSLFNADIVPCVFATRDL